MLISIYYLCTWETPDHLISGVAVSLDTPVEIFYVLLKFLLINLDRLADML